MTQLQHLPAVVHEHFCPLRDPPGETPISVLGGEPTNLGLPVNPEMVLKFGSRLSQLCSGCGPAHLGACWEIFMSVPLEPGWLTLIWAVNPKAALGLILGQSCLPRHHPVTWQEHSQGLGRRHTIYTTDNSPAVCGPNCRPWNRLLSPNPLNKVLEAVPYTQEPDRIHICLSFW